MIVSVRVLLVLTCFLLVHEESCLAGEAPFEPLLLTPYLDKGQIDTARKLSTTYIGNVTSNSGYFTVNKACESNLFFWFFKALKDWQTSPVVLWLNGGPGATSLFGLFVEQIGPWNYLKSGFKPNKWTWTRDLNIIIIDQPVGTGFSFTNKGCYAENMTVVRNDMYSALTQFFKLFPELKSNTFFMTGEAYAGTFIPAIAREIDLQNPTAPVKINLTGIIMGNPFIDIRCIYTPEYLFQLGIVGSIERDEIKISYDQFIQALDAKDYTKANELAPAAFGAKQLKESGLPSPYNILYEHDPAVDFQFFVTNDKTRKQLHVGPTPFSLSSDTVREKLKFYQYHSEAKTFIEELLKTNNYFVGLYAGQLDVVCLYSSIPCVLKTLDWPDKKEYQNATRLDWYVNQTLAGWIKIGGNLWEVAVRKSGHFVPTDRGQAIRRLIYAAVQDVPGLPLLTNLFDFNYSN